MQELGRPKPKLQVTTREADEDGVVAAAALRPWPVDVERVVTNELADARHTVELAGMGAASFDRFFGLGDPMVRRPTEADHEIARAAFEGGLVDYEAELREWLAGYQDASRRCANTFTVTLRLDNAAAGAHAEKVTVHVRMPDGAERVAELPEVDVPPGRPTYQPPQPRRITDLRVFDVGRPAISPLEALYRGTDLAEPPDPWRPVDDGRAVELEAGDPQAGRSVTLGTSLLIRVAGPGRHELTWTVYSKSLRRPKTGTLVLDLPEGPPRRAFGRVEGILSFPDVPIVDPDATEEYEDGEDELFKPRVARREVRSSDPPAAPPTFEDEDGDGVPAVLRHLGQANEVARWRRLGLDPEHDGPEHYEVRPVERDADGPAAA